MGCAASAPLSGRQNCQSFHVKYKLGGTVGRGSFAQVRLATDVETRQEIAVKIIDLKSTRSLCLHGDPKDADDLDDEAHPKMLEIAMNEAVIHQRVGIHQNVVRMLDDPFLEGRIFYMPLEKCGVSLRNSLESSCEVTEGMLALIFKEMLQAIAYIHRKCIVHRDIKPDNFIYGIPSSDRQQPDLKLCDFGLSEAVPDNSKLLRGTFGTAPFMSPEMVSGKGCNEKTDIWSMSVIAYVFLLGQFPYTPRKRTSTLMQQAISEGRPPAQFKVCTKLLPIEGPSAKALSFLRVIFNRDMKSRLSAKHALRLPFLSTASCSKYNGGSSNLKPMVSEAAKCGAFDPKKMVTEGDISCVLNALQLQHQGHGLEADMRDADVEVASLVPQHHSHSSSDVTRTSSESDSINGKLACGTESTTAPDSNEWSSQTDMEGSLFDVQHGDLGRLEVR